MFAIGFFWMGDAGKPMRTLGGVFCKVAGMVWVNVVGCDGLPVCPNNRLHRGTDKSGLERWWMLGRWVA